MPSRMAGKLLTSPFAFLLAGVIDLCLFAAAGLGRCVRHLTRGASDIGAR